MAIPGYSRRPGPPSTLGGPTQPPPPPKTWSPVRPGPPPGTWRPPGPPGPPGPPSQTLPPRTPIDPNQWGAAGAKTLNWYANRQLHPHAERPRVVAARSAEEELEQRLQLEAESDGVECIGYVPSEVLNEHPSELPDFDRRMWAADPFYGWRTQEKDIQDVVKPLQLNPGPSRRPTELPATAPQVTPLSLEETAQEPTGPTWMQWFMGDSPPEAAAQVFEMPQKSMLPHAKELVFNPQERLERQHVEKFPGELPSPSLAELRPILEPEMAAAGIAWDDVDGELWEELDFAGELRRAASKPHEFPGRLRKLSVRFSQHPPISIPLEALLVHETSPQHQEVPSSSQAQVPIAGGGPETSETPGEGTFERTLQEGQEQKPKKKKKDKNKKDNKDDEGCQIT